jgi:hypothetical protein
MAVLNIWSPGQLGGSGSTTQTVQNPWGVTDVWIQCGTPATEPSDNPSISAFGIIEVEYLDGQGIPQSTQFADPGDLSDIHPGDFPTRLFQPRLVAATFVLLTYAAWSEGSATFFEWG